MSHAVDEVGAQLGRSAWRRQVTEPRPAPPSTMTVGAAELGPRAIAPLRDGITTPGSHEPRGREVGAPPGRAAWRPQFTEPRPAPPSRMTVGTAEVGPRAIEVRVRVAYLAAPAWPLADPRDGKGGFGAEQDRLRETPLRSFLDLNLLQNPRTDGEHQLAHVAAAVF